MNENDARTKSRAGRLGALLIGYYDADEDGSPVLRYAGRVGAGFTVGAERLAPRSARAEASPFVGTQPPTWPAVEPELVAEVEFQEWTRGVAPSSLLQGPA